jgi:hypothetical protein
MAVMFASSYSTFASSATSCVNKKIEMHARSGGEQNRENGVPAYKQTHGGHGWKRASV